MKNNQFLKYVNEYKLACEGIGNIAKRTFKNIVPTSQNIKKAQKGESLIGRTAKQIDNIHDTLVNVGNAAEQGDLKAMINAFNVGINKHAEMKASWLNRQAILSFNYLKDIKQGALFVISKKDELITSLLELYPTLKKYIKDDLELQVTKVSNIHYNDYNNNNFDQLWGQIYTVPTNEELQRSFNAFNINGLYISFNSENVTNDCYCVWIDNNLNPIAGLSQIHKTVKLESDGKYSLSVFNGNDIGDIINDFLNSINRNYLMTRNFFLILNNLANTIAMRKRKIHGHTANNELFNMWTNYFVNNIDTNKYPNIREKINTNDIKKYFTLDINIPINQTIDEKLINLRPIFDEIIKSGSI